MSVVWPDDAALDNGIARQKSCDRWEWFGKVSDMNVQGTGIAVWTASNAFSTIWSE